MKIEKLRKNHKKEIIIGTILTVVIGGALTYKLTHSKYRVTQSIDLGSGVINYKVPDFKIMAVKLSDDGETYNDSNEIPTSGYTLNTINSSCKVSDAIDDSITINYHDGVIGIDNLTQKGTKCYLYFDKILGKTMDNIIATIKASSSYKGTATPAFNTIAQGAETEANNGIYATTDGTNMYSGTTYYWRGAATTNHVIFASSCWRIVRINGDKTMRLIYNGLTNNNDGKTCKDNGENSDAVIYNSTSTYLNRYTDICTNSSYVGWTYESNSQRPSETNNNGNVGSSSIAKAQTEKWYNTIIGNNPTYSSKVAEGKFCNDRNVGQPLSTDSGYVTTWSATGTNFRYAGAKRLYESYQPTFNCNNAGDVYTLQVGAISADEVAFAGGKNADNTSYYLYTGKGYWTMSPFDWYDEFGGNSSVLVAGSSGSLSQTVVSSTSVGLRPVINLKADTTFASGGTGTQSNPYIVR